GVRVDMRAGAPKPLLQRRSLLLAASELRQHRLDRAALERRHGRARGDRAFRVAGRGALAEAQREALALTGGEDLAGDLGGLAEAKRQHAGGERVEASDVARLRTREERPNALQCCIRREAPRLVEQQDAAGHAGQGLEHPGGPAPVSGGPGSAPGAGCDVGASAPAGAPATARLMRLVRRAASATLSSNTNSSRGA